jgi:hypothetical protein
LQQDSSSEDKNDKDTAYSSGNLSEVEFVKKKKKQNNYKLYDIKEKKDKKLEPINFAKERKQSSNVYSSTSLTLDSISNNEIKSNYANKTTTTNSFQIDPAVRFKRHQSISHPYPYGFNPMMSNFYYNIEELFNFRFQRYIINYTETVERNLLNLKETKDMIIHELEKLLKQSLGNIIPNPRRGYKY